MNQKIMVIFFFIFKRHKFFFLILFVSHCGSKIADKISYAFLVFYFHILQGKFFIPTCVSFISTITWMLFTAYISDTFISKPFSLPFFLCTHMSPAFTHELCHSKLLMSFQNFSSSSLSTWESLYHLIFRLSLLFTYQRIIYIIKRK